MDPGIGQFLIHILFVGLESPKELSSDSFWPLLDRKTFATNEFLLLENILPSILSLHCTPLWLYREEIFQMVEKILINEWSINKQMETD